MSKTKKNRRLSALDLYNAYPHVDLIPIDKPPPGMSITEFVEQRGEQLVNCGDTLFTFLFLELAGNEEDIAECLNLVEAAQSDLEAVMDALLKWDKEASGEQGTT